MPYRRSVFPIALVVLLASLSDSFAKDCQRMKGADLTQRYNKSIRKANPTQSY